VLKKDGSPRFCVDYRKLNDVTKKDAYPLKRIDETMECLAGAKWFCTLDLASGYWQVEMDEESKDKTAFVTRNGLFRFTVMPFGLCNAPATFERLMEMVLRGLAWKRCLVYLDDIIAFGTGFSDTLDNLQAVFERLRSANLKLKPSKCELFKTHVVYLGHLVSAEGISCSPAKVEEIENWPAPRSVGEVRSFLGLASYYRRYICAFSEVVSPLTALLRKTAKFKWEERQEDAFAELKRLLTCAPILAYSIIGGKYILDTDASGHGIGAVLSQIQDGEERVICYASKTLSRTQRNYCTTKRELLAVVYFVKYFRHYLYGVPFLLRTDHASLKWLVNFKNPEGMLARWISILSTYDYVTEYRPGKEHGNADALSRKPHKLCKWAECPQCGPVLEEKTGTNTRSYQTQTVAVQVPEGGWSQIDVSVDIPQATVRTDPSAIVPSDSLATVRTDSLATVRTDPTPTVRTDPLAVVQRDPPAAVRTGRRLLETIYETELEEGIEEHWETSEDTEEEPNEVSEILSDSGNIDQCAVVNGDPEPGPDVAAGAQGEGEPEPQQTTDFDVWADFWSYEKLRKWQQTDSQISWALKRKEEGLPRPEWKDMAGRGKFARALYVQWNRLEVQNGVLYRLWREEASSRDLYQVVTPQCLKGKVMYFLHNVRTAGHLGINKTIARVRQRFYWPMYQEDVYRWCVKCPVCAKYKLKRRRKGKMKHQPSGVAMERVAIDLAVNLPVTQKGNVNILIVTEYFTRWTEAYAIPDGTAETVAEYLVTNFFCRFGLPKFLHSDQGTNFESKLFTEVCRLLEIHKTRTSPYRPQSDGSAEKMVKATKDMLSAFTEDNGDDWDQHLPYVMMALRSTMNETTKCSPALMMLGRELNLPIDIVMEGRPDTEMFSECPVEYVQQLESKMLRSFEFCRKQTEKAVSRNKENYNKTVYEKSFKPGDWVWYYYPPCEKN
jgi:transposase InsO family protein